MEIITNRGQYVFVARNRKLLKDGITASGHSMEEAIMIINHKHAMDFILQAPEYFSKVNVTKIEDIHKILPNNLNIGSGLRKTPVGIIGTNYKPLDNVFSIRKALEKACICINKMSFGLEKALIAIAIISYIQPFADCNNRTARIVGNALLLAHSFCPLSYKSVNELEYKKAIIIFYEQNSISYFKQLFIEQFKSAIDRYF